MRHWHAELLVKLYGVPSGSLETMKTLTVTLIAVPRPLSPILPAA
jgi:hypothetical protein